MVADGKNDIDGGKEQRLPNFQVNVCYRACSIMNGECYDDCNDDAKRTAA